MVRTTPRNRSRRSARKSTTTPAWSKAGPTHTKVSTSMPPACSTRRTRRSGRAMTQYLDAKSAVGGDPDQLRSSADVLTTSAAEAEDFANAFSNAAKTTMDFWQGMAGDAYRTHASGQVSVVAALPEPLKKAATAFDTLATDLEKAQQQAGQAMQRSVQIGMDSGDLVGRPWKVAMFVLSHPDEIFEVGQLIWR